MQSDCKHIHSPELGRLKVLEPRVTTDTDVTASGIDTTLVCVFGKEPPPIKKEQVFGPPKGHTPSKHHSTNILFAR